MKRIYLPLVIRQPSESGPIPVTFTLQDGLDGYAGTKDTTLNGWEPDTSFGDDKVLALSYSQEAGTTPRKTPVLRFDLSLLPTGAIVQNATLRLYTPSTLLHYVDVRVHGLLRAWHEYNATWRLAAPDQPWSQPGASAVGLDRSDWTSKEQRIAEGSRWYEFDVTALVQEWSRIQGANHGFILSALEGDSEGSVEARFVSREGAQALRPQLVVSYRPGGSAAEP